MKQKWPWYWTAQQVIVVLLSAFVTEVDCSQKVAFEANHVEGLRYVGAQADICSNSILNHLVNIIANTNSTHFSLFK